MFRQRMEEVRPDSDQFVSRVGEIPVVNDALSQLSAVYSGVKGHNRLFRFAFETAECGVHAVVVRTVPPVLAKFEKPIETLNTIACQQLDKLEREYPIITKPSDEVMHETKQLCDHAVKPIVDRVSSVKQYGVGKVTSARQYTTDTIGSVKAYGVDRLYSVADCSKQQVYNVLGTPFCNEVVKNVDAILGVADNLVEKWLPEAEPREKEEVGEPAFLARASADDESVKKHAMVMSKAATIGNKVRRRMYNKIANQMTNLQLRTKETVQHLNFTVDLIEYSRTSMDKAKCKAAYVWTEINKTDEQVARERAEGAEATEPRIFNNANLERRAIATARHLTQKLYTLFHSVGIPIERLPVVLQSQVDHARKLVLSMKNSIPSTLDKDEGLPKYAIDNLRNYANLLLRTTSTMADWARHVASMTPVVGRFIQAPSTPRPDDYELLPESKVEQMLQSMSMSSSKPQTQSADSSRQHAGAQQNEKPLEEQDENDKDKKE